jgi:hypothetical protein
MLTTKIEKEASMTPNGIDPNSRSHRQEFNASGKLLLGTGLAFASLILVPALATQIGLGVSLTGALRIALMKASSRIVAGRVNGSEATAPAISCH